MLIKMVDGQPDINQGITPYRGYVFCDKIGNWGAYLISGTVTQLTAIIALSEVVGIVTVTDGRSELNNIIVPNIRTKLNNKLTELGKPNIPDGWTYRKIVKEVFKRFNSHFNLDIFDVKDNG